jgi:hypothetical protein
MQVESAAYDNRDPSLLTFFATADSSKTPLLRFTPDPEARQFAQQTGDYSELLHTPGTNEFLVMNMRRKTFTWTTNYEKAISSVEEHYPNPEGISESTTIPCLFHCFLQDLN